VPLILSLLPAPNINREEEHKHLPSRVMNAVGLFLIGKKATVSIFGATGLLMIWSVYYGWAPPLGESKPGSPILFADSEYNIAAAHIADRFAGANQFSIYFEGDKAHKMKEPEVVAMMEEFGRYMSNTFNYGGTREIPHLVRSINRLYHYDDPRWSVIPKDQKDIGNTLFMYEAGAAMPGVILEYMDLEGKTANFVVFYKDATGKTVHTAVDAAKAWLDEHKVEGVTPRFAGGIIGTTAAANEETKASDLKMTGLIILLVMISVMVTYKSIMSGLLCLVVLGLAVMMNRAFMSIRDIGLNVNTMPVTSVGVGLGVDYALYMLDRIKEEVKHRDLDDAIVVSMRTTGAAVLFTAVMVIAGIVYWIPGSSLRFNSDMSLLLCLLMVSNMIGAVTVIPLLVRVLKPSFVMKEHVDAHVTAQDANQSGWATGKAT
jgi:predicted RND superfamily exporter protein